MPYIYFHAIYFLPCHIFLPIYFFPCHIYFLHAIYFLCIIIFPMCHHYISLFVLLNSPSCIIIFPFLHYYIINLLYTLLCITIAISLNYYFSHRAFLFFFHVFFSFRAFLFFPPCIINYFTLNI